MRALSRAIRLALSATAVFINESVSAAASSSFPAIYNSEKGTNQLLTPEAALRQMSLPRGFNATVFAGEPDVQQPIAIAFDERGRLWVVENYTYAESKVNFDERLRDRIVIFEDTDGDGRFDKRTVFWDQAQKLTSIELGFGGVWALCAPNLIFIPDRNHDDVPDGPPEILLDGWNDGPVRHNIVNGLRWGPDGWLYGRHGIMATSLVGAPTSAESNRQKINCGIWRYHPTRKVFEVVAHGTTNPWGMDYDDYGEMFFINTVIGHLWHVIPGAHYKRMYGEDFDVHTYELIDQHADHYHWDTGKSWQDSRDAKGEHGPLGGGHAHSGLMIYLGDNWPEIYRNTLFTINLHGRRLNNDRLERFGSGYTGRHQADLFQTRDPWFRAVELGYGPDGGVFVADWSDVGECHDNDGVHRTSGRIYKLFYGQPRATGIFDLSKLSDSELVKLQLHRNDWYVRQARRILQERAAEGRDMRPVHLLLRDLFAKQNDIPRKLRVMWTLAVTGGDSIDWLIEHTKNPDEHIRAWAVRRLTEETPVKQRIAQLLAHQAGTEPSGLVRLYLASALQRLAVAERRELAMALLTDRRNAEDHNLPLMIWYGTEPLVRADPSWAVAALGQTASPLWRQFVARRLTEDLDANPAPVNALVKAAADFPAAIRLDILRGMKNATRGWRKAAQPSAWNQLVQRASADSNDETAKHLRELSTIFGDGRALAELQTIALDDSADPETRREAARSVLQSRAGDLGLFLENLLTNKITMAIAVKALASLDQPDAPARALSYYPQLSREERAQVTDALASRAAAAKELLGVIAAGKIPRTEITPYHARQIASLGDSNITQQLSLLWGEVRRTPEEKARVIAAHKTALTADRLKTAHRGKGRAIFQQTCAACHRLYGEGGTIGPDLTGSGRQNLDYLLENIIDPNAMVPVDFRMSEVKLKDERTLNGVVGNTTERTVTLQTMTEKMVLERKDVSEIRHSSASLMPEGLLDTLPPDQVRDLIAYLMSPDQVSLLDK